MLALLAIGFGGYKAYQRWFAANVFPELASKRVLALTPTKARTWVRQVQSERDAGDNGYARRAG